METQKIQQEKQSSPVAPTPAMTSCRKKKKDDATFLEDLKDHIDEFVNASMEEHKTCFSKTIKKVRVPICVKLLFILYLYSISYWMIYAGFSDVWCVKSCSRKEC